MGMRHRVAVGLLAVVALAAAICIWSFSREGHPGRLTEAERCELLSRIAGVKERQARESTGGFLFSMEGLLAAMDVVEKNEPLLRPIILEHRLERQDETMGRLVFLFVAKDWEPLGLELRVDSEEGSPLIPVEAYPAFGPRGVKVGVKMLGRLLMFPVVLRKDLTSRKDEDAWRKYLQLEWRFSGPGLLPEFPPILVGPSELGLCRARLIGKNGMNSQWVVVGSAQSPVTASGPSPENTPADGRGWREYFKEQVEAKKRLEADRAGGVADPQPHE